MEEGRIVGEGEAGNNGAGKLKMNFIFRMAPA
jgi:hypothetical protein